MTPIKGRPELEPKKRDSSLELLRILSMLLIVAHHFSVHGVWPTGSIFSSDVVLQFLILGGKTGVNVFVLITGYFMIDSRFKVRSFLRVYLATMFYSVGFLLVFLVADRDLVTMSRLWKALLPIATTTYWFVAAYLALYVLSPFLNRLANDLTRTVYKRLLIVLFVMLSVIPTFAPLFTSPSITSVDFVFAWLPWFAFLYLLAGYFKRYQVEPFSRRTWVYIFLADTLLMLAGTFAIQWLGRLGISYLSAEYFGTLSVVPALVFSVSLFFVFKNLRLRHNRLINTVAGTTFGVYLIHDNQFIEAWLWRQFGFSYAFPPLQFLLFACAVTVAVFCVCSALEYVRAQVLERPGFALLERHASKRLDSWDAWMNGDDVAGTGPD